MLLNKLRNDARLTCNMQAPPQILEDLSTRTLLAFPLVETCMSLVRICAPMCADGGEPMDHNFD